jgi:predicted phage terminase large subunit-like protein
MSDSALDYVTPEAAAFSRLLPFVCYMYPFYKPSWFHRHIARKLEDLESGKIERLLISMPPRHGKSMLASEFFIPWYLGRNPNHEVIFATYGQSLASDVGSKIRSIIQDASYADVFPGVSLDKSTQSKQQLKIMHAGLENRELPGSAIARGIGGSITGKGAHVLILDDPYKGRKEADSPVFRKAVTDYYTSVLRTRVYAGGKICMIMTRWRDDDLFGELQKVGDEKWDVISFPAIDEADRTLWPEMYSREQYLAIKNTIGVRDWNALFQQAPLQDTGNVFLKEFFRLFPYNEGKLPEFDIIIQSLDCSFKDGYDNDYTAHVTLGTFNPRAFFKDDSLPPIGVLILDCWHEKLTFPKLREAVAKEYNYVYGPNDKEVDVMVIEDAAAGISLIQELRFTGLNVLPYNPGRDDKLARAHAITHLIELGYVWIPESKRKPGEIMDQFVPFMKEILEFDRGAHDDFVDAFVQAMRFLSDRGYIRAPELVTIIKDYQPGSTYHNPYMA